MKLHELHIRTAASYESKPEGSLVGKLEVKDPLGAVEINLSHVQCVAILKIVTNDLITATESAAVKMIEALHDATLVLTEGDAHE